MASLWPSHDRVLTCTLPSHTMHQKHCQDKNREMLLVRIILIDFLFLSLSMTCSLSFLPFLSISLTLSIFLSFVMFLSFLRSHYIPLYKYPLGDRGEAIFKGRIRIPQHAQLTDSDQICRTIMLGDRARIIAMPTLEITADNVVCR